MSWLWKSDPSSPASYEKALQKLSTQLNTASLSLEISRSRARRLKALWTLYTILAYLISAAILVLVLGPQKWHTPHYIGLIGAPIIIYGVRTLLALLFDWRIGRKQANVESIQKQREAKLEDLKKATKYNSTQELLQKYGTFPKQSPSKVHQGTKRKIVSPQTQPQRTGLPPPPTANIVRPGSQPNTPQRQNVPESPVSNGLVRNTQSSHSLTTSPVSPYVEEPGFAPNAFNSGMPLLRSSYDRPSYWYDRILDVILGEDETLPKNRLALICSTCRLVNGQAPPGVQTLEQVGIWRCSSCGVKNGAESEPKKILEDMVESPKNRCEDWQPASRAEDESSKEPAKEIDRATMNKDLVEERNHSEDDGSQSDSGGAAKATGTGRVGGSRGDAPVITNRVTRSTKKEYDDEDQGW